MATELRPDIQAAKDRLRIRMGAGREFKKLPEHLWVNETVEMLCIGTYGRGQGLLALTNTRLLFLFDGITGGTSEDFPFDKISSIQWSKGMLTGTITIFASGNKAEVKNANNDDGKAIADRVRAIISGQASAGPAQPATVHAAAPVVAPTSNGFDPVGAHSTPPPPGIPANWYPDPSGNAAILRYWDGSAWTEHTAPRPPQ